jgi:hypothetical protein
MSSPAGRSVYRQRAQRRRRLDGGGGFRSMLQVVMVMGLGYSLLVMAFS